MWCSDIFNKKQYKKTDIIHECPECKSHIILYDETHDHIFCSQCGLILYENYHYYFSTFIY